MENNIELIDASCPVVLKLQNRVKFSYDQNIEQDGQVVIYGIPGHAEVNGLIGQTDQTAIIVTTEDDLNKIDFKRPILIFSQTTKSTKGFYRIKEMIEQRAKEAGNDKVDTNDTICRQVSNRDSQLKKFAKNFDVIIFVSGKKSSNGKVLYEVCKSENQKTHFVGDESELKLQWFVDAKTVGICGATSTPMWLMEQISGYIKGNFAA